MAAFAPVKNAPILIEGECEPLRVIRKTMKKTTVLDAIIEVLKGSKEPLSAIEIGEKIVSRNLYQFNTSNIVGIVSNTLRRHCEGSMMAMTRKIVFEKDKNGRYHLKPDFYGQTS